MASTIAANVRSVGACCNLHRAPQKTHTARRAVPSRHTELQSEQHVDVEKHRIVVEDDSRYNRQDLSDVHAFQARRAFAANIAGGESRIRLAEAALQVAAEDDSIATHSTVLLPVDAYLQRLQQMAVDIARVLSGLTAGSSNTKCSNGSGSSSGSRASAAAATVIDTVEAELYQRLGFRMPPFGRSGLPPNSIVDHAGVWEDARLALLNEVLVRKVGHPAAISIIYSDIMQRLLQLGAIDFAVCMDCRGFQELPRAMPLPGWTREKVLQPDGSVLNTCTSEALVELLRYLKRAYWPYPWDSSIDSSPATVNDGSQGANEGSAAAVGSGSGNGSLGGFRGAAKAVLDASTSASLRVISAAASHRLDRGIFTSAAAGDLRRAVAAAERLVMLCGDVAPEERRDLGVLLLHAGQFARADAELRAYAATSAARAADPVDAALVARLLDFIDSLEGAPTWRRQPAQLTSVGWVLQAEAVSAPVRGKKPLTW